MLVHHILRINRNSYVTVQAMINQGLLQHQPKARLQHNELRGNLYTPRPKLPLVALSDTCVQAAAYRLNAEISRLPSAEYSAIVRANPDFTQCPHLVKIMQSMQWEKAGYDQNCSNLLLPTELSFTAGWNATRWACLERCNHWFLVVWFDLTYLNNYNKPITTEVALDLGANPVVCVADNQDLLQNLDKPTLDVPTPYKNLLENNVTLSERVEFEVMRNHLLGYTWLLVHFASVVYLEDLTYRGMDKNFVSWTRRTGVLDWHESWLPARLAASGIPMEKVDPRGTSQLCSRCQYPYGQRDRHDFCCPHCGLEMDAHRNAAENILALGELKGQFWQAAHANTRKGR